MNNILRIIAMSAIFISCSGNTDCIVPIQRSDECLVVNIPANRQKAYFAKPITKQDTICFDFMFTSDMRYVHIDAENDDFLDVSKIIGMSDEMGLRKGKGFGPSEAVRLSWQNIMINNNHRVWGTLYVNHKDNNIILPLESDYGDHVFFEPYVWYQGCVIAHDSIYKVIVTDELDVDYQAETKRVSSSLKRQVLGPYAGGQEQYTYDLGLIICPNNFEFNKCR